MAESRAQYELGGISSVRPEAIGEPGKRTFRLLLESGAAFAFLWLEKEQLYQLGDYLQKATETATAEGSSEGAPEPQWAGGVASIDFKVSKMSLAHSPANDSFLLVAHDQEDPDGNDPKVSFWLGLSQAKALALDALRVCASGRPICALCGRPIDPDGHNCPRSNGHAKDLEF